MNVYEYHTLPVQLNILLHGFTEGIYILQLRMKN